MSILISADLVQPTSFYISTLELTNYSVAGSDTTSTALTVILWHLLANPETLRKLTSEVCEKFKSAEEIKYQDLRSLPYLHAVIEEGLRICPPNPGLIPRVVVDRSPGNLVIGKHVFPPGVSKV